jgi:hypothetical protein
MGKSRSYDVRHLDFMRFEAIDDLMATANRPKHSLNPLYDADQVIGTIT